MLRGLPESFRRAYPEVQIYFLIIAYWGLARGSSVTDFKTKYFLNRLKIWWYDDFDFNRYCVEFQL